jgi:hypothetical protein
LRLAVGVWISVWLSFAVWLWLADGAGFVGSLRVVLHSLLSGFDELFQGFIIFGSLWGI